MAAVSPAENTPLAPNYFGWVKVALEFIGESVMLVGDSAKRIVSSRFEFGETLNQMAFIGVASVPIVALTGFFSGAVFSLYLSRFLVQYGAGTFVGATVGLSMTREIGPVIAGLMVAARCGSAMAAQIGTMKVTEQIDALRMLSVHPTNYLVIPRLVAGLTMLPVLALICMWSGTLGGALVAQSERVPTAAFLNSVQSYVTSGDVLQGLVKAPVFGLLIALVACQQGLRTSNGAVGVGRSTTNAVVLAMIAVYVADFIIANVMTK